MTPYFEDHGVTVYHGDCREILPTLGPLGAVVAARRLGMTCIGIDIDEKCCEITVKRLRQKTFDFGVSA